MANVATYLTTDLKSSYNLWKSLTAGDTVTCYYFDLPYRVKGERFAQEPSSDNKTTAQSIATWLTANVASFTYSVLTLDNYDPFWAAVPELELINKASSGSFDKIYIPHSEDDVDSHHTKIRAAVTYLAANEYTLGSTTVEYPLMAADLGLSNAVSDLPADVLSLISDPMKAGIVSSIAAGTSNADITALIKSFQDGTSEYADFDDDGEWFIDSHPQFGSYISPVPFLTTHPYYKYLTV